MQGLDQNPAYYELLQEAAFKEKPEPNVTQWLVQRAHRRYGLIPLGVVTDKTVTDKTITVKAVTDRKVTDKNVTVGYNEDVAIAWALMGGSGYAHDGLVHDPTAVGSLTPKPSAEAWTG